MATIVRNPHQSGSTVFPSLFQDWDSFRVPLRVMDQLLRSEYAPERVQRRADQPSFVPHFDVKESGEGFLFRADLPGVKESDLDISVHGNRLTISGKRDVEERKESESYFLLERSHGSFSRSFTLPDTADLERAKADLKDGVLTVVLPKRVEAQPRKLSVNTGAAAGTTTGTSK
jgi:HSP20 family protein